MSSFHGNWRPGIPKNATGVILLVFAVQIIIRGLDYIGGDNRFAHTLSGIEQAAPLPLWGVICVGSGLAVIVGMVTKHSLPIVVGGIIAMAVHGSLSVGALIPIVHDGWPWDGLRIPFDYLARTIVWGALSWGTYIVRESRK